MLVERITRILNVKHVHSVWHMHCSANVVYYFISFTHEHLLIISKMNTSYMPIAVQNGSNESPHLLPN